MAYLPYQLVSLPDFFHQQYDLFYPFEDDSLAVKPAKFLGEVGQVSGGLVDGLKLR